MIWSDRQVRSAIRGAGKRGWIAAVAIVVLMTAVGGGASPPEPGEPAAVQEEGQGMKRVTGIGGVFFRSDDPAKVVAWYRSHLGIDAADWGGFAFQWREKERPDETGYTVWSAFPETTDYFAPGEQAFMVNFRVADLEGLIAALKAEGVEVVGGIEQHPNGRFAWILDPEGRKVELWQPVPSAEDPYLK